MGTIRDFYNLHRFFPEKVMKFALGLFLNEMSNFPPFFIGETSSGYKMEVCLRTTVAQSLCQSAF